MKGTLALQSLSSGMVKWQSLGQAVMVSQSYIIYHISLDFEQLYSILCFMPLFCD